MELLVGVALLLWTMVGRAGEESEPKMRLWSKKKEERLSLARIGYYYWLKMAKQVRLMAQFVGSYLPAEPEGLQVAHHTAKVLSGQRKNS